MGWKILLPQDIAAKGKDYLVERGHELVIGSGTHTADICKDIKGMDAMVIPVSKVSREVFEAADQLKVVVHYGADYDTVDLKAAKEFGVIVLNCPEANSISVAETTIFYMLYCSRNYTVVRRDFIDDYYKAQINTPKHELEGKTAGIIGCGNIGSKVAVKCMNGFNMKVLAYDPYKPASAFPKGVEVVRDLNRIFRESDFVSLHWGTRTGAVEPVCMEQFRLMKPTAFFINTTHGQAVNEVDLYQACEEKIIAGAALDVMQKEPVEKNNPLLYLENVVISPHIGAATKEADERMGLHAAMGIQEVYEGRIPTWEMKPPKYRNKSALKVYED